MDFDRAENIPGSGGPPKKCAFTGHRNAHYYNDGTEPLIYTLKRAIKQLLDEGCEEFYCGMAQGFDLMAAQCLLEFKNDYNFRLIAVKPCADQTATFTSKNRRLHDEILKDCHDVIVLSDAYFKGCMQMRDRYLVDNCDALICFLRKSYGGTYYTVNYARKKGLKIIEV